MNRALPQVDTKSHRFDTAARESIMSAMRTRFILAAVVAAMFQPAPLVAEVRFQRTYGGSGDDRGWSVKQTSDGGFILAGFTTSYGAGLYDIYLIRTDARGDTIWTRTYGDFGSDYAYSVVQTSDGGFAVAGSIRRSGIDSAYVLKTDPQGTIQWQKAYAGILYSIQRTADGGFCLVGQNQNDVYIVRTSETGDTLWTRTFGDTAEDRGYGLAQTPDGGFVITGWTFSFGDGSGDVYLIRIDSHGDSLWTRTYGGGETEYGASIEVTSDSGYIVAGSTESFGTPGTYGVYLIRTTADGDTLWTRALGGPLFSEGMSVVRTTDGGCVVAGCTESYGAGGSDVYLIGANPSGDTVWTRTFGGIDDDGAFSIQRTTDGGYVIAGQKGPDRSGDVYLIKTDSSGSLGVTEGRSRPQAVSRNPSATITRRLPEGTVTFDAMGRRAVHPKPGIYFLRTTATAVPRKTLLVE
jgi:hypothetical protein